MSIRYFFARLFVSKRKQIALMADANLRFASPLREGRSEMEISVKNLADAMIFHTAICAEASQICPYRRAKSDI